MARSNPVPGSISRVSTPGSPPDPARRTGTAEAPRPVYSTGGVAAATAAGIGLAVIVTLTMVGWVAAPHDTFGEEIVDLLQGAVLAWLVGHHVSFSVPEGSISLLPIGLVLLPGLLLYRSGRWVARNCEIARLRHVHRAAIAIAGPYAAIAGTLALLARTDTVEPSMPRALLMGFVIAFLAGGLGVLRQLMRDKGVVARDLLGLMPARSRSLLVGMLASTGTLLLGGFLLFLVALAVSLPEAVETTRLLAPGWVGGLLLLLIQLAYLPNAVVFAVCYALGPGFAVGEMTVVAPTGVSVGPLPLLPMLAALPENGAAPVSSLAALAVPFVAGAVGGVLTQRSAPDVVSEAAPLWGFVCGVTTGLLCAALGELAGGSLGGHRLSDVGPSAWQVGLVAALEVGVAAAIAAWVANWWYTRRSPAAATAAPTATAGAPAEDAPEPEAERAARVELPADVPVGEGLATVTPLRPREDKGGGVAVEEAPEAPAEDAAPAGPTAEEERERKERERAERAEARTAARAARAADRERKREERRARRAERPRLWRRRAAEDDSEDLYGITYEAGPDEVDGPRP
ncbi:cell division protein PerM [Nocardiopsis changdeensis]|uniref:cell division protein PerM n=1 Tax=Nocardiopsis changdeensis TaxID=2831969 RepID=UPI003F44A760